VTGHVREAAAALARTALFAGLDAQALDRLARIAKRISFPANGIIFQKGDTGRSLYVIERGRVKIAASSVHGREVALNLLGPGEIFGEIALVDGGPRTADAIACDPARLLALERRELIPFLEASPDATLRMLVALARRVRWVSDTFEDAAFLSLPTRLAKRLIFLDRHFGLSGSAGRRLTVSLPQRELANHLNVTRETINRLLQEWRDEGLITIDRGVFVLKNMERLARIAESA
jgi:CRP/FNR family transcriptional regulator, cyclic AMP receptor protein